MDEIDGRKVSAAEALDAIVPEMAATTELTALLFLPDGPRRAAPRAPEEAWDEATTETPAIFRLATALAPSLRTPLTAARLPETDGEKDCLKPLEPETDVAELEACTEADP
jgi:hypothetical protein